MRTLSLLFLVTAASGCGYIPYSALAGVSQAVTQAEQPAPAPQQVSPPPRQQPQSASSQTDAFGRTEDYYRRQAEENAALKAKSDAEIAERHRRMAEEWERKRQGEIERLTKKQAEEDKETARLIAENKAKSEAAEAEKRERFAAVEKMRHDREAEEEREAKEAAEKQSRVRRIAAAKPKQPTVAETPDMSLKELSFWEMRSTCRNWIQDRLDNYNIDFQHANMEEPVRKLNTQYWKSWFRLPNGNRQVFMCKYYMKTQTGDIVPLQRLEY